MMGCGASKNDVIKSATSGENEPKKKPTAGGTEANGDTNTKSNGINKARSNHKVEDSHSSSSKDSSSRNSLDSEGSTIPASEKFGNGNNNDVRGGGGFDPSLRSASGINKNLPELPPLKPARTSKVGFILDNMDNKQSEGATGSDGDKSSKAMPVAFEVPAEEGDASLIKKHPPRRLRQLEERPSETGVITQEALEEKVALANERRNQVLHQRVASARTKSARAGGRIRTRPVLDSELETNETIEGDPESNPPGQ